MSFLQNFRGADVQEWMLDHLEVPILATAVYSVMVLYVPDHYMAKRPAFNFRIANIIWNFCLTTFSLMGAYYCVPQILKMLYTPTYEEALPDGTMEVLHGSWYNAVCVWNDNQFFNGPVGFFVASFILSKIPEMLDTAFLVFQKKRIIFLHWYHHITVMLYCWHAYVNRIASGLMFASMNYGVHSVMYFYYFMCALGFRKLVRPIAPIITLLQIVQMVVGTYVELLSLYYIYFTDKPCHADPANIRLGCMMYISYFVLFSKLFKDSYLGKSKKRSLRKGSCETESSLSTVSDEPVKSMKNGNGNGNGAAAKKTE